MVISTVSLKGGSGKTTISVNIAVELARRNKKVVLIDADPNNQNAVKWSGMRPENLPLVTTVSITDPNALRKNLPDLKSRYDFVLIDGTPALAVLTGTIMLCSDLTILPLRSSTWDVWAFDEKFIPKLEDARALRPDLDCRILRNAVDKRKTISKDVMEVIEDYDIPIMDSSVGDRTIFEKSPMEGKGVCECKDLDAIYEITELVNECENILESKLEMA